MTSASWRVVGKKATLRLCGEFVGMCPFKGGIASIFKQEETMGAVKQWLIEEAGREAQENRGKCWRCGCLLAREEREADRDECFECYCDSQD